MENFKNNQEENIEIIKSTILEAFQEMDWEQLNTIGAKIQAKAGVKEIRKKIPKEVVFQKLINNRVAQVNNSTHFKGDNLHIEVDTKDTNEAVTIFVDANYFNNADLVFDQELIKKLKTYITETFIHEFAHLISNNEPDVIHNDVTEEELPHTIVRSGVNQTEVIGKMNLSDTLGKRLNEALTEYVAELIQEEYISTNVTQDKNKRHVSYDNYVVMFKVLVIALERETGVHADKIKQSFLRGYFTDEDLISDNFIKSLPEDLQYSYLELLKTDLTDSQDLIWEYTQHLSSKYQITREEISQI